jgi:hypothetical protein
LDAATALATIAVLAAVACDAATLPNTLVAVVSGGSTADAQLLNIVNKAIAITFFISTPF